MFTITRKAFISIKPYELFRMIRINIFITVQDITMCNHTRSRDVYSKVPLLSKCSLNCKDGHLNIKSNTSLDKAQSSLIKWKKTKQESIFMGVINQSSSLLLSITGLLFSLSIRRISSTPVYHLKAVWRYLRLRLPYTNVTIEDVKIQCFDTHIPKLATSPECTTLSGKH